MVNEIRGHGGETFEVRNHKNYNEGGSIQRHFDTQKLVVYFQKLFFKTKTLIELENKIKNRGCTVTQSNKKGTYLPVTVGAQSHTGTHAGFWPYFCTRSAARHITFMYVKNYSNNKREY